jgi:hypothetical protein
LGPARRFESASGRTRRQIDSRSKIVGSKNVHHDGLRFERALEAVHVPVRTRIGLERSLYQEVGDLPQRRCCGAYVHQYIPICGGSRISSSLLQPMQEYHLSTD